MTLVAQFEIHHSAFIGADGERLQPLPARLADRETLRTLYEWMALTRAFDSKAIALQRTGQLGTYASSLGQEAIGIGVAHAMQANDILVPSFREHGAQLYRGVTMQELYSYWGGDERGSNFSNVRQDFPVCATVGGQAPHATGVALALKLRNEKQVVVCIFGDGATSKGDVYEAMNIAGVWQLPVVFVATNNQYAISTPRRQQTAAATLAQKALASGFGGEQVDGNDIIAVSDATFRAAESARAGNGPHLIEGLTYRLADHTTSDDARRYRQATELRAQQQHDPLSRLRAFLARQGGWFDDDQERLTAHCQEQAELAARAYLATAPPQPQDMFDYLYAELPQDLLSQRQEAVACFSDSHE